MRGVERGSLLVALTAVATLVRAAHAEDESFYIADENIGPGGDGSHAAIIVIDMDTCLARRVLDGDKWRKS